MNRHFYRCVGCLEVVVLGDVLPMRWSVSVATCGICGEHLEYMGRVRSERLVKDRLVCRCDSRCVCARGPICDCPCEGANHGSGLAGYVAVPTDVGAVPVVHPGSTERNAQALAQYREYRELAARLDNERVALEQRRASREYLGRELFIRMVRTIPAALRSAKDARTHAARMRHLTRALGSAPVVAA